MKSRRTTERPSAWVTAEASESLSANHSQRMISWGVLAAILALALMIRTTRLGEQSVWLDEYNIIGFIHADSLNAYLTFIRSLGPEMMPLYFSTLYGWSRIMGTDTEMLRLLSVLFSLASIGLVYLIAVRVYSRKAALLAALLAALSPFHLDLAQAPRPNAMFEMLALLSLYTLMRAVHRDRLWWWGIHLAVNLALMWTHVFAVFLLAVEGFFILIGDIAHKRFVHTLVWGIVTSLAAVSPYIWLRSAAPYMQEASFDFVMSLPPWKTFMADWLADDAVMMSDPFIFQGQTWSFLSDGVQKGFVSAHIVYDFALMAMFAFAFVYVVIRLARASRKGAANLLGNPSRYNELLVLFFALAPLLVLLFVSIVWRPCILPRYTCYSSYGAYILCAGVFAGLRLGILRRIGIAFLLALFACQLSLAFPAVIRTDFLSVSRYLKSQAHAQDIILVKGPFVAWETLRFHFADKPPCPILPVYSFQALCEDSRRFFAQKGNTDVTLWAVAEPFVYTFPAKEALEACFRRYGLTADLTLFPGMNGLQLYRIRPDTAASAPPPPCCTDIPAKTEYGALAHGLVVGGLPVGRTAEAEKAIRRVADTEWPQSKFYFVLLSFYLNMDRAPDLAEYAARRALLSEPAYSFGHFALALALAEKGDVRNARQSLDTAVRNDTISFFQYFQPLFDALYLRGDMAMARQELKALDRMGVFLPAILRMRTGLLPGSDLFPPR